MPRAAVLSREEQATEPVVDVENGSNGGATEKRRGSPFMHALLPEMVNEPYPLDFADGMDSFDFAKEKCRRMIVGPLDFESQKEWLDFAKAVWTWIETASDREARAQADQLVQQIKDLIAETEKSPKLNQLIKEKLAAVVEAE